MAERRPIVLIDGNLLELPVGDTTPGSGGGGGSAGQLTNAVIVNGDWATGDLTGWTTVTGVPSVSGSQLIHGATDGADYAVEQVVNLPNALAGGQFTVTVNAANDSSNNTDEGLVTLTFLNDADQTLQTINTTVAQNTAAMAEFLISDILPIDTAKVRISLRGVFEQGSVVNVDFGTVSMIYEQKVIPAFTELTDTPADYIGQAGNAVIVNQTENGLEFGAAPSAGGENNVSAVFSGAMVKRTAGQSIPNNVTTTLSFQEEVYDEGGWYDPANPTRLTVPAGVTKVRVSGNAHRASASSQVLIESTKNGVEFDGMFSADTDTSGQDFVNGVSAVIDVVPGDYFEMNVYMTGSANIEGSTQTWFAIEAVAGTAVLAEVPQGGTTGQILSKASDTNYDLAWIDAPVGGGDSAFPNVTSWNAQALDEQPTNWTVTTGAVILDTSQAGVTPRSGNVFLKTNGFLASAVAHEDVPITTREQGMYVDLTYWHARDTNTGDTVRVDLIFLDSTNTQISTVGTTDGVPAAADTWERVSLKDTQVPDNCTTVRVQVTFSRGSGSELNAYIDDIDISFKNDVASGGGGGLPAGGTTGQILAKASDTDGDGTWIDAPSSGGTAYEFGSTFDYANEWGQGNRTTVLNVTTNATISGGNPNNMLDGSTNGNTSNAWYWSTTSADTWVAVEFPVPVRIDQMTWFQNNTTAHGTWRVEASNDGTNWDIVSSDFTLANSIFDLDLLPPLIGYTRYRLWKVSGSRSNSPWLTEWTFRIATTTVVESFTLEALTDTDVTVKTDQHAVIWDETAQKFVMGLPPTGSGATPSAGGDYTFDETAVPANHTLSNGNKTITKDTGSNDWRTFVYSTDALPATGLWYFEIVNQAGNFTDNFSIGIMDPANKPNSGSTPLYDDGWGWYQNGQQWINGVNTAGGPTYGVGDVLRVLYDADNARVAYAVNGGLLALDAIETVNWTNLSGAAFSADPVLAVNNRRGGVSVRINLDETEMIYSVPNGAGVLGTSAPLEWNLARQTKLDSLVSGYRQKQISGAYTVLEDDLLGDGFLKNTAPATVTVPAGLTGMQPATFIQAVVNQITFAADVGVTLISPDGNLLTRTQGSTVTLVQDEDIPDTWYLFGDLTT